MCSSRISEVFDYFAFAIPRRSSKVTMQPTWGITQSSKHSSLTSCSSCCSGNLRTLCPSPPTTSPLSQLPPNLALPSPHRRNPASPRGPPHHTRSKGRTARPQTTSPCLQTHLCILWCNPWGTLNHWTNHQNSLFPCNLLKKNPEIALASFCGKCVLYQEHIISNRLRIHVCAGQPSWMDVGTVQCCIECIFMLKTKWCIHRLFSPNPHASDDSFRIYTVNHACCKWLVL